MKRNIINAFLVACAALTSVSCLKDLDALPLNPTDFTSEMAYGTEYDAYVSGLAKVYNGMYDCWTAQGVGNGSQGSFLAAQWLIDECSTDEMLYSSSNESWAHVVNFNTWNENPNDLTTGLYANSMLTITYANEYLIQTADEKLDARGVDDALKAKIHGLRAEARFIRAFAYWALIDHYGNIPFVDETTPIGKTAPQYMLRKDAFDWVVGQLEELVSGNELPEAAANYPRVDKGCALGLLVRIYLNAEVYTGTAMWSETKSTCERLFNLHKYDLCPNYDWLFCGDNGENPDALKEIIFANFQDITNTAWNWGGCTLILAQAQDSDMMNDGQPLGFGAAWSGSHMPTEWVERFFKPTNVNYETGEYTVSDNRGRFYIKGHSPEMSEMDDVWTFKKGWAVAKWTNIPHNMTAAEYSEQAYRCQFANTEYIYIRLGEIYLAYAEACLKLGQANVGLPYLNALRKRGGAAEVSSYDAEFLFEEYSRELYWEAHRRRDLIRFDKFCGANYLWRWKGGSYEGQSFPDYKKLFPIPTTDLQANENLQQNPGYNKTN